jgi:hypothetical protein
MQDCLTEKLSDASFTPSQVEAIDKVCRDRVFNNFDAIKIDDRSLRRYKDSWYPVEKKVQGSFLASEILGNIVFKHLIDPSDKANEIEDAAEAAEFLRRINSNDDAIGIEKRPISPLRRRSFAIYTIGINGESEERIEENAIQVEKVFPGTCQEAMENNWILPEEVPSLVACLVQGSLTLLKAGICPLDVKLANIAYLGRGSVMHVDLRGSFQKGPLWKYKSSCTLASSILSKQEVKEFLKEKNLEEECKRAFQMHVFLLGCCSISLVTGKPFSWKNIGDEKSSIKDLLKENKICTTEQKDTLLEMIHVNRNKRPSIEAIEGVFPKSLIKQADGLPKHSWEKKFVS